MKKFLIFLIALFSTIVYSMELTTMSNFTDGKFEFQSAKTVYWSGVVEGRGYIDRAEKIIIPAQLYMPKNISEKIPAMVIVHGIGGLYTRDGKKRAYWEYAELLAENGIAAVIVDTHGARGVGVSTMLGSAEVPVYSFAADAFAVADLLRTHPQIDSDRIGIMGFSKGGSTSLLASDQRFTSLSKTKSAFKLHIPIYPGCQTFPAVLQPTRAQVHMLLGSEDNFTGISGCFEIEQKLKESNTPTKITVYKGAHHGWDENVSLIRSYDVSSEDCRWILHDSGVVSGKNRQPILNSSDGNTYFKNCTKQSTIWIGRNESANKSGRQAVIDTVKQYLVDPVKP